MNKQDIPINQLPIPPFLEEKEEESRLTIGTIIFWACIALALGVIAMEARGQQVYDCTDGTCVIKASVLHPCSSSINVGEECYVDSMIFRRELDSSRVIDSPIGFKDRLCDGSCMNSQTCAEGSIEVEGRIKFRCIDGTWKALNNPWSPPVETKAQETQLERECRQSTICINYGGEVTYPAMAVPGPEERAQELREEDEDKAKPATTWSTFSSMEFLNCSLSMKGSQRNSVVTCHAGGHDYTFVGPLTLRLELP